MDSEIYGPAMRALNERQRAFVLAMAANPFGNQTAWARAAGYEHATSGSLRVLAHRLAHDPKIQAASSEIAQAHLHTFGPILASIGLLRVAKDKKHPKHLRALEMIANRVGLHETTEHVVNVNHTDRTGAAMAERIAKLAGALGLDPGQLLGVNAEPKLIEPRSFPPDTFGTAMLPPGKILSIDCE